jgi:hypothetical protein
MGGGLMQLVAYGAQDIYLTGNPQITFFKVVYRRHTNFSMESIKQTFNGTADFGSSASATISRNGDLVYRMYLEHKTTLANSAGGGTNNNLGIFERYGDSLIKECEIEIGGQKIDKHTSMWNRVYSDLTQFNPTGHFAPSDPSAAVAAGNGTLYQLMTGNTIGINTDAYGDDENEFGIGDTNVNGFLSADDASGGSASITVNNIFIPLNFWFNRNPGLALPLIALQYHEVKVKMTFEQLSKLGVTSDEADFDNDNAITSTVTSSGSEFNLWCDYIYLDTDERRRFAQVSHEYLIEQLQFSENTISTDSPSIDLNFNHPVKELIWCTRNETVQSSAKGGRNQPKAYNLGDFTSGEVSLDEMGGNWQLKLNGHDRFKERDSKYFTRTQVWQHHTGYGALPTYGNKDFDGFVDQSTSGAAADAVKQGGDSIAVYSFALKPEEHQPSGTCNFSRIDNAQLVGSSLQVWQSTGNNTTAMGAISDMTSPIVKLTIFAVNYNVLRIMSGMGGLAYSN